MKKNKNISKKDKEDTYKEQLKLNTSLKILLDAHTFLVYKKEKELKEIFGELNSVIKPFDKVM